MSEARTKYRRSIGGLLLGLGALALVTLGCLRLDFGSEPAGFLYLILVVLLSRTTGFVPAAVVSMIAIGCLKYVFIAPEHGTPIHTVELAAFLLTALVTTRLVDRSTRAVRLAEERARLLDLTHDAVVITGGNDRITYWNRGAEALYGWSADEALGRPASELLQTTSSVPLADIAADLLRTGSWQGELENRTRDRKRVVVASRSVLQRDESGEPISFLITANDITERKQAEDELRSSEARFRILADHAGDAFFLHHASGRLIDVNVQACESLGYTREELLASPTGDVLPDVAAVFERFQGREDDVITFESQLRRKNGTLFPVEVRTRFFERDGRPLAISLARDITERKKAEQEVRDAQAALAHVMRVTTLGEVTANFAHELNQPLAAIANNANACLGLLPDGREEVREVREALADVVRDAERASAVIERVRALAMRSIPEQVEVRLRDVVDDILALAGAEALARHVKCTSMCPRTCRPCSAIVSSSSRCCSTWW